jgi:hypothetical protein
MTPPSVIIPRSATELKKAKQLNGTASASNKSRFRQMSLASSLASPPNCILAHLDVRTTLSTGTRGRCRMHGGMSYRALGDGQPPRRHQALRETPSAAFSIDWLARALRHNELANLVVRQTKASRRLDDLALFVGAWHAPAWAFLLTGLCCDNCSRLIWLSPH